MGFVEQPIINSPFAKPAVHYELDEDGQPTGNRRDGRRPSQYLVPVPAPRRRRREQLDLSLDAEGEQSRITENVLINEIRKQVDQWRDLPSSQWGVTPETQRLLLHWRRGDRERKLFFCQREAVETLIYLTEVDPKRFRRQLEDANVEANAELFRIACKMATGSGKTTVMGLIIAWHAINRARRPSSRTFSDAFLVVAPGITIRDRLRVLLPQDTNNIYDQLDLVPRDLMDDVRKARIVITNFHAFKPRAKEHLSALNKQILASRDRDPKELFVESEGEMIARVAKGLMGRRNIVVLNDEAHHCYRERAGGQEERVDAEEREEVNRNKEAARVWISGLEAFKRKLGLSVVYDLSATPFFLRGSGYDEGTLFPWVVTDFSLIDAIESGIVKVPRLPVLDDAVSGDMPKFRKLYAHLKEANALPKKGRAKQKKSEMDPEQLHPLLSGAMHALYGHYKGVFDAWEATPQLGRPPVFIVVCNNTATSKLVYDWIAGYDRDEGEGDAKVTRTVKGKLDLFSNVDKDGRWLQRPRTLLIDSEQLESGEALTDEFRKVAAREIEDFKRELRQRGDARDVDKLTDADILREVMNTVGQAGRLGGDIRCVVSVSMLTEGWDANTVTHVLGVRAFGTQLLCEQVVGRALRRVSYDLDRPPEEIEVEYADVLGIPYISYAASTADKAPRPPVEPTRVHAVDDRAHLEIRFPNVQGYRVVYPRQRLAPKFTSDSDLELTPDDVPTRTVNEPLIGEGITLKLGHEGEVRDKTIAFHIAGFTLRTYFRDDAGAVEIWRFGDILRIAELWLRDHLKCRGNVPRGILLWQSVGQKAAVRIARACAPVNAGPEAILPILNSYNIEGSSKHVRFETTKRALFDTKGPPPKCHLNYVVYDSDWEAAFAEQLQDIPEVLAYVKNHSLGLEVPYEMDRETRAYRPDYIVYLDDGRGLADPLKLVCEIKGQRDAADAAKAETMRNLWVPAVNNDGRFGRWDFEEISEAPYDVPKRLREVIARNSLGRAA
jgi:type III restriction enzyme